MITFLSFAPIEYMGGAERTILDLYNLTKNEEESQMLTSDLFISNIYSLIALRHNFPNRNVDNSIIEKNKNIKLTFQSYIPGTKKWKSIRLLFKNSRLIYFKAEINEIIILLYFTGFNVFNKSIASVLSPWIYSEPISITDKLHNFIYSSKLMQILLRKIKKIQLLTPKDLMYFKQHFNLNNLVLIPNKAVTINCTPEINSGPLKILFVGELIPRKGIDLLLKIIENANSNYFISIVGDGKLRAQVEKVAKSSKFCKYYGYISNKRDLINIYKKNDVFILPSRAEGFAGVILEALSAGLPIVVSPNIDHGFPENIEYVPKISSYKEYLAIIEKLYKLKFQKKLDKKIVQKYFLTHFTNEIVNPMYYKLFFN